MRESRTRTRTRTQREVLITFDLPLSEKLSLEESLALIAKQGYQRLLLNGEVVRLDEAARSSTLRASRHPRHLTVVQDRLKLAPANRARFVEACEQAYHFGKGKLAIHCTRHCVRLQPSAASQTVFQPAALRQCDIEYREPSPALFSFNIPSAPARPAEALAASSPSITTSPFPTARKRWPRRR